MMSEILSKISEIRSDMVPRSFQDETRLWREQIKAMLQQIIILDKEILKNLSSGTELTTGNFIYGFF